jgi:polyamine oxidase
MWFVFVVAVLIESIMATNVTEVDVLILGAGITGIKAGNHFQNNNLTNFLILEAQDYIGGRIKQVKVGNVTVGEGATWVHIEEEGDENPILTLANEINLEKYTNNEDDIVVK